MYVWCLGVINGVFVVLQLDTTATLKDVCIHHFATDSAFYDDIVSASQVKELYLLAQRLPGWEFSQLQRLHFSWQKYSQFIGGILFPINGILKHPQLTYVAISLPEGSQFPSFIPTLI